MDGQKLAKYNEFVDSIQFDELFDYIRKVTGLNDLKFVTTVKENRNGKPVISFTSQNIVDKVGFLKLIFSSLTVANFNSEIKYKSEIESFIYWCTVAIQYEHPNGGSNGVTFLRAIYKNGYWEFDKYYD